MEETKKMDEATKSEELAERVELTDEQLDQASGGLKPTIMRRPISKATLDEETTGLIVVP